MLMSGHAIRHAAVGVLGFGAIAAAVLFGGAPSAFAQPTPTPSPEPAGPPPPGCTAADLAAVSSGVAAATSDYLFGHPDVNNFFTSLRGLPREELPDRIRTYMDANPQARSDLTAIRQPLTDLRNRCQEPLSP
jgi:hemophore-related protein